MENLVVEAGPHIKDWDIEECWLWGDWPERTGRFPESTRTDVGIDAVAKRGDQYIAIQCKARKLDASGKGDDIHKGELDKFTAAASAPIWAERWLVTNGANQLSSEAKQGLSVAAQQLKLVNIHADLLAQPLVEQAEYCPHCDPDAARDDDGNPPRQTLQCMQNEAVEESVNALKEHVQSDSGGLPAGQARGKIVLPCGTGKTRISLRIIEELTQQGELAVVLCPSIALVAQIRREYLQNARKSICALAVCSDPTVAPKESSLDRAADPTLDASYVSASEVKGKVTTDSGEIADWIRAGQSSERVNVIFGTYQSSHKIGEALVASGAVAAVLIADEAHRTAGLRRMPKLEKQLRDFTICHDNGRFPATYRVYQTATPRVYDAKEQQRHKQEDWVVRSMDDATVFGVELYRRSYKEAVSNGWLSDYRIIALGVNDLEAYEAANALASDATNEGRQSLTTTHFLRGLAFTLAMGGATQSNEVDSVSIKSCIAFMNTVEKSKNMARHLQTDKVREWLRGRLEATPRAPAAAQYTLEHLDATSNVAARENAKSRLANADRENPHGIVNVGIFGEGTDAPSLSAVAFLEPRKSPIDVIQAVGRVMRSAQGKEMGYIICPIVFPPNAEAEQWLAASGPQDGWQELGQILRALRAHDSRIEDEIRHLMKVYLPPEPEEEATVVATATPETKIQTWVHAGKPGEAQETAEAIAKGQQTYPGTLTPLDDYARETEDPETDYGSEDTPLIPTAIITAKVNDGGEVETRIDSVGRDNPGPDGAPGQLNIEKTIDKAKKMINEDAGIRLPPRVKRTTEDVAESNAQRLLDLLAGAEKQHCSSVPAPSPNLTDAIIVNLLSKSGLRTNRVMRDLNILEAGVGEAARHLREDRLSNALDAHFQLDNLKTESRNKQADGCTIAALLMMNAAMLHQRIASGRWISGVSPLESVKNDVNVVRRLLREWNEIMSRDFKAVLDPAIKAIQAAEDTGKLAGLERALWHIAAEAERIAETYADMGADHAGPLFNRVMGNQASDGAFFTRPTAAFIAASLTLDACGDVDWSDPEVWKAHKIVDLACGSGTLLAAMLAEMKRRARAQGASEEKLAALQKLAVEDTIKGLDINPVSLQLAASQLTAGNHEIRYRRMGLRLMPYGPSPHDSARVFTGTLELLGQRELLPRVGELDLPDEAIKSKQVWDPRDDVELEDAVDAAKDARIVIMNPPFTNRAKMGEKFPREMQQALRSRADTMEETLVRNDRDMGDFADKNSIAPLFVALADKCLDSSHSVLAMVHPTIAMTATSASVTRRTLAQRYHISDVLTCHLPGQINLSQHVKINESIIVAKRRGEHQAPTRFIQLDRWPSDNNEAADLHDCLTRCEGGLLEHGWGEVSEWPAERIEDGDWTPAVWRSPELAEAAFGFANDAGLQPMAKGGLSH